GGSLKGLLIIIVILTALSVAGKIIGCGGTTWLMGNGWNESLRVGSVMVGRGALELVLISYGLFIGYIDTLQSAALITVTLLTVFLAPLLHGVFRKG
ncbi:MAG: cation:proton antiporter, partial [Thermoplasmata archaeon]